jgi:hypothetical protein
MAVLMQGVPRLKEWAFAGLTFDVIGALYSHLSVGDPPAAWMPAAIGVMLVSGAYVAYRMRPKGDNTTRARDRLANSGQAAALEPQLG